MVADGGGTRNNPIPLRRMKNENGAGFGWENPILLRIMAENMGAVLTLSAAYPLRMLLLGLDNDCCCAAITPVSSE